MQAAEKVEVNHQSPTALPSRFSMDFTLLFQVSNFSEKLPNTIYNAEDTGRHGGGNAF